MPVVLILAAGPLAAKTYNITGILDPAGFPNGFGSSVFHDQTSGQMNGATIDDPLDAIGTWDSMTGDISFTMNLNGGGSVSVTGALLKSNRAPSVSSAGFKGVYTATPLQFSFSGDSQFNGASMSFTFADVWHNPEANGYTNELISLWGDNGEFATQGKSGCQNSGECLGADLRLAIAAVPLPAPIALLLTALAGLFGLRRFRRVKAV